MKSFLIFTQILHSFFNGMMIPNITPDISSNLPIVTQDKTTSPSKTNVKSEEPKVVHKLNPESPITTENEQQLAVNEWNRIPILEYHNIGPVEQRWTRQYDRFREDLLWLYNNDYILLSIDDFSRNHFPIPKGKKPVILTFDDGKQNQFNYLEDGSIDPNCAIGILDEFYQQYPSFGRAAVFYVNHTPFGQKEWVQKKINYLLNTGRQIGYHTLNHTTLNTMSAEVANSTLVQQRKALNQYLPPENISRTLAYPHGAVPNGDLNQMKETIDLGLLVGADPAYPLYHPRGSAYRTPRIQAIDSEWLRHFGRQPSEVSRQKASEKFKPFVSDGNPNIRTPSDL